MVACTPQHLPPARQAADEFFLKIGENRLQEAYDNTTFSFQAQSSFKSFQAIAKELGLTAGTVSCTWAKEEPKGDDIKLTGEVMTASGTTVAISVTFLQERGAWRLYSLLTPNQNGKKEEDRFSLLGKGDAFTRSVNQEMPNDQRLQVIVEHSVTLFGNAIRTRDFHEFYSKVSLEWQKQLTEKKLQGAFQPFIDAKVDINIKGLPPVFDKPPEINSEGLLILIGHYDTKPYVTTFRLRLTYEFPQWKLYGVEVQLRN
jgi:hypothetical protein